MMSGFHGRLVAFAALRFEIIGAFEQDQIHLIAGHEFDARDLAVALWRDRCNVCFREDDRILVVQVCPIDVRVLDSFIAYLAAPLNREIVTL